MLCIKIGGCVWRISPWLMAVLTLMMLLDRTSQMPAVLLAMAVHEIGHLLVMACFGCFPTAIELLPFAIHIVRRGMRRGCLCEVLISLGGIVSNLLVAAGAFFIGRGNSVWIVFSAANFILAAFQALPVHGLDGWQVIRSVRLRFDPTNRWEWIQTAMSALVLTVLAGAAVWLLVYRYNPTLLLFCLYTVVTLPRYREE